MKKTVKFFIYFFTILLLIEIAARVKLSLQSNNYRYLVYYNGIVKVPPEDFFNTCLLKAIQFKRIRDNQKTVIMVGSSILECVKADLEPKLAKEGWQNFKFIDGRKQQLIEFGDNSLILLETMILPAVHSDFAFARNKLRRLLGVNLYTNLYNNSVFFLMFSEKITSAVSFTQEAKLGFIEEMLPIYDNTLENLHNSGAKAIFINFPNYFLKGGNKLYGQHCGQVAAMASKKLTGLSNKYFINYLDIYGLHNDEFKKEDYTGDFHLRGQGAKKAAAYIFEAVQKLPN
ncbi:MAG: hypothetical protein WC442_01360 [Candidatus Omnitrophota bacterium]